jgi:hypothetical protein
MSHPLVPGVRCDEIRDPNWPRTLHDKHLTGFSPLALGMTEAPEIWATIEAGGTLEWIQTIQIQGVTRLLAYDGRLRLIELDGHVVWTAEEPSRQLIFCGDIRGNGRDALLVTFGPRLTLIDAATGRTDWSFAFDDPNVHLNVEVADILPEQPGLEAVVFQGHGVEACLFQFPPRGNPTMPWRMNAINPAEGWSGRIDHGVSIKVDLSVPHAPMVWNQRHHRLLGFDARTGECVSALEYSIGGGHRRNYAHWALGTGPKGEPLAIVVGAAIETHVHTLRLSRSGPSALAWQHYYGEGYQNHGVAVRMVEIHDVDGDGAWEVVYNTRDPAHDFRSFVRVRDGLTGAIEIELADRWAVAAFAGVGDGHAGGLLTLAAPGGVMAVSGDITAGIFTANGTLEEIGTIRQARLWGPHLVPGNEGNNLLLRQGNVLVRYTVRDGRLVELVRTEAPALLQSPVRSVVSVHDAEDQYLVVTPRGTLESLSWDGASQWELPLRLAGPSSVAAADLDGDGRAELIAAGPDHRVRIFSFRDSGRSEEVANHELHMEIGRHGPLLFDLTGSGEWCLIAPGTTDDGRIAIRAYRADHSLLWERPLDYSTAHDGRVVTCNAARALPDGGAVVVAHLTNQLRSNDATIGLDGRTGKVLWEKRGAYNGFPYRPEGIVGAVDVDGDGIDELANDMLVYLSYVRGADGSIALVRELGDMGATGLYNCFTPLYRNGNDTKPHWLVPSGTGRFGMLGPDFNTIWFEDAGYDVPGHVGIIDVDGDGGLEAGYALKSSRVFTCRNVWTGGIEWQLELESPPNSPVLSADVDGDGKGEFLAGRYCIGTDDQGSGQVRFELPVPLAVPETYSYGYLKGGYALIADFDGDGKGEIACTANGRVVILKARGTGTSGN